MVAKDKEQQQPTPYNINNVLLMGRINNELPICSVISGDLNAQNSAIEILSIQLAVKLMYSHHQMDINKLSTNLPII